MTKKQSNLSLQSFNEGLQSVEAVARPSDGVDIVGDEAVHRVGQVIAGLHCSAYTDQR